MLSLSIFRPVSLLLGFTLAVIAIQPAASAVTDDDTFISPYQPSPDVMGDVNQALEQAKDSDKLALIVMGATWCHDSRGLARRFRDEEVSAVLEEDYVTLFVDVGHLDQAREVNKRFGMPSIYATPTVMIVDPETERLTNAQTMHRWRDADSISYSDTRQYFAEEAQRARTPELVPGGAFNDYLAAIAAFEAREAARLVKGYDIIGPQLAMGRGNYPDGFEKLWGEVRQFRYRLTDDLLALRAKAKDFAEAGLSEPLDFPTYPPLSWEQ